MSGGGDIDDIEAYLEAQVDVSNRLYCLLLDIDIYYCLFLYIGES